MSSSSLDNLLESRQRFWQSAPSDNIENYHGDPTGRRKWFARVVVALKPKSVLELGCNEGANLRAIHELDPSIELAGIDINEAATAYARGALPSANIITGSLYDARKYFPERFDLVFTMGVFIHIPPEGLSAARDQARALGKMVVHCEENEMVGRVLKRDAAGVPVRWTHNYSQLYAGQNVRVYNRIIGGEGGSHHLITVNAPHLIYLGQILPFVQGIKNRLPVFSVKGK